MNKNIMNSIVKNINFNENRIKINYVDEMVYIPSNILKFLYYVKKPIDNYYYEFIKMKDINLLTIYTGYDKNTNIYDNCFAFKIINDIGIIENYSFKEINTELGLTDGEGYIIFGKIDIKYIIKFLKDLQKTYDDYEYIKLNNFVDIYDS